MIGDSVSLIVAPSPMLEHRSRFARSQRVAHRLDFDVQPLHMVVMWVAAAVRQDHRMLPALRLRHAGGHPVGEPEESASAKCEGLHRLEAQLGLGEVAVSEVLGEQHDVPERRLRRDRHSPYRVEVLKKIRPVAGVREVVVVVADDERPDLLHVLPNVLFVSGSTQRTGKFRA